MVCSLQTPRWVLPHRAGLQSATEVPSESVIELTWGQALPTLPLATIFYNIYYGTDLLTLFDTPKNFSLQLSASIPTSLATDGYYFGIKASQLGVAAYFNGLSNMALNATAFAYPAHINLTQPLNTTGVVTRIFIDGYAGFPLRDGYVEIGNEILLYSTVDGYGPSLVVSSKNPFGCNDGYASYPIGTDVQLWRGFEEGNSVSFIPTHACILPEPEWGFNAPPGLNASLDLGLGTSVELRWGPAIAPGGAQVFYNVYYNTDFESLFNAPQGITEEEGNIIVPELDPGTIYYFAVRATYFTNDWDIAELTQLSQDFFAYPQGVEVNELDGYYFESEMTPLRVTSTDGFPDSGFILVGSEIMAYSSKTATTFIISDRDIFDFDQLADHANGTDVLLYRGIEDNNTTSFRAVPSWDKRQDSPKMEVPDGGPDYLQDADGYRSFPTDNLTEDHSISEDENDDRAEYPYCGYRATNFVDLYNRNLCNTYFGGRQDGFGGGIDVAEANLQREELLLASTGEPFVLLKRKWTGKVCRSITHRQEHPDARCPNCFVPGTLVRAESGYKPIESIVVGEKVLTSDGKFRSVTEVFERDYYGEVLEISTSSSASPIIVTPEHPFLTMRGAHSAVISRKCGPKCDNYINNGDGFIVGEPSLLPSGNWWARAQSFGERNIGRMSLGSYPNHQQAQQVIVDYKLSNPGHELVWDLADNLDVDDWLVSIWPSDERDLDIIKIPIDFHGISAHPHKDRIGSNEFIVDEEFLWIVGMYLAEGSHKKSFKDGGSGGGSIIFALHAHEVEFQERIVAFFEKYGYNPRVTISKEPKLSAVVTVNSSMLAEWFPRWLGHHCYNKQIPEELMRLPKHKSWALIKGIYDGDGDKSCNEIGQTSEKLSLQICEILHRLGEQPLIRQQRGTIQLESGNFRRVAYINSWAESTTRHTNRKGRWAFGDRLLSKISNISTKIYGGKVYNLEIEENHTYVVQGILVHNCFGTGFVGGYDRYIHPRPIRPNDDNINGFIMMRVSPYDDDLDLNPERGLNQIDRLQVWTTALPAIHDRDILIRYIGDRDFNIIGEEFRYVVDFTNRNKLLFGLDGRQQMTIKRLDKTHEVYKVEVELT